MKENNKIKHPFLVPENFHDDFKTELIERIEQASSDKGHIKLLKFAKIYFKYAAIIAIAFFIGRYSYRIENNPSEKVDLATIYNQVSEDNIIEFVIEEDLLDNI